MASGNLIAAEVSLKLLLRNRPGLAEAWVQAGSDPTRARTLAEQALAATRRR